MTKPGRDADVVVVGGGGVGAAAAWQLAARGADVVLLEQFAPRHTQGAPHGASRIFRIAHPEPTYVRMALEALPLWRALEDESGSALLTMTGGITHGRTADLDLLAGLVPSPPLRVTQQQPAHFRPVRADLAFPVFVHHAEPAGYPAPVYGLGTPGEGIEAGFHGTGPECDPDRRDFHPEPTRSRTLRRYAREWLPGVDPDTFTSISCTHTSTETSDFLLDRRGPVVVVAGFSGHGFEFLPAIGRVLAELALTGNRSGRRFRLTTVRKERR